MIHIPVFSEDEGTACLLEHACVHAVDNATSQAALKLHRQLGGLPLGITSIAAFMRFCRLHITECADEYKAVMRQAREVRGRTTRYDDYEKDLSTVWTMSFRNLAWEPKATTLLGILSFLAADSIPVSVFELRETHGMDVPQEIMFCRDKIE